MYDPRFNKMAQVLVNYSLEVQPGQNVYVWSMTLAQPLMLEVYRAVLKVGGNAFLRADLPGATEIFYQAAQGAQLDFVSPVDKISVEPDQFQHYVRIGAEYNSRQLSHADPAKMQRQKIAQRPMFTQRIELSAQGKYNWVITQFPTEAYAMDADMSLDEYTEFVFSACLLNETDPVARWRDIGMNQACYTDYLKDKDVITVKGANMDLTLRVKGRVWMNSQGNRNFPDGEISTGPIEDSVNGWINYTYPGIYQGREVECIWLEFANGRVVKATATKNEAFLNSVLDMDEGARTLGEFGIGTNYTHHPVLRESVVRREDRRHDSPGLWRGRP